METVKNKRIPRNKWVKRKLKKYYQEYKKVEAEFRHSLRKLEEQMQREFRTPEMEFFQVDDGIVGIGTPANPKIMKLVHFEELEGNI